MPLITRQPTANQSPDPGQGGLTVTSPVNTGHDVTTTVDVVPPSPVTRTCIWTGFAAAGVPVGGIRLKFDWAYINALSDAGGDGNTNLFRVEYSVNSGGAWTAALTRTNVNGSDSGSVSQVVPIQQDITIIQVRDLMRATAGATQTGRIDPSVSNITLEIVAADSQPVVIM